MPGKKNPVNLYFVLYFSDFLEARSLFDYAQSVELPIDDNSRTESFGGSMESTNHMLSLVRNLFLICLIDYYDVISHILFINGKAYTNTQHVPLLSSLLVHPKVDYYRFLFLIVGSIREMCTIEELKTKGILKGDGGGVTYCYSYAFLTALDIDHEDIYSAVSTRW